MKDKFNKYCSEVIGYRYSLDFDMMSVYDDGEGFEILACKYNPYDDLNQMAEVFDKLWNKTLPKSLQLTQGVNAFKSDLCHSLEKATRNFIISTMEDK